jgi:TolB-like protein
VDQPVPQDWKKRIFRNALRALGVLAVILTGLIVWSYHQRATESAQFAILPFRADSTSTELAKTITDSLAGRLARIRGFTVLPAALSAGHAESRDSAHGIARALGVRYIVIGWVERSPTPAAPERIMIDSRLIDTGDSPPTMGEIVTTLSSDLCAGIAQIAVDIAGHFARAPRGHLWGPGGATGCAEPKLLDRRDDASS